MDKTIYQYLIDNEGLHKIIRNDDNPKLIKPVDGEIVEKYESDFREPVGKSLAVKVENTGKNSPRVRQN